MKQIQVSDFYSTNLNADFEKIITIEIEDKPFNGGAFGDVYFSTSINNKRASIPQVIKIFTDNLSGSANLNYNTILKLQKKISKKNDELLVTLKKSILEEYPAFAGIPQFSFIGKLNGKIVKGFSSNNLKSLGFEEFKEILENDTLLDKYQSLPIEKKMIVAYQFVSAFKILKECSFIHADIKPEAIFVNTNSDTCAIIDFDSGVVTDNIGDDATTWGAPNDWVAPEIWKQLGQVSNQQRKIDVDLFTDTWSVAIGIHYFFATCHPLFFLTELSPNVIDEYFNKHKNKWPEINKSVRYFNQKYHVIYNKYISFLNSNIPKEVIEQLANTINNGYLDPLRRTTYDKWKTVLEKTQNPPQILSFESNQKVAIDGTPIILKWKIDKATSISIDNGVGDVSDKNEVTVFPQKYSIYKLTASNYYGSISAELSIKIFPTPILDSLMIPTPDFRINTNVTAIKISTPNISNKIEINNQLIVKQPSFSTLNQSIFEAKPIIKMEKLSIDEIFEKIKAQILNNI